MSLEVLTQGGGTGGESASIFITGLSETDAVSATKDGKTVQGKWTQKANPASVGLPDGYTQLEYLESTGTQYITTNLTTDGSYFAAEGAVEFSAVKTASFGSNNSGIGSGYLYIASNQAVSVYAYSSGDLVIEENALNKKYEFDFKCSSNSVSATVNGIAYNGTYSGSLSMLPMYLFGRNSNGTINAANGCKLWPLKWYSNPNELMAYFVPAKRNSDSVYGLYDTVNDVFYTNAGSGTFTAGAEIPATLDGHIIPVKSYGMWTVTATNGEQTATQDVLVDAAVEYEIPMSLSA